MKSERKKQSWNKMCYWKKQNHDNLHEWNITLATSVHPHQLGIHTLCICETKMFSSRHEGKKPNTNPVLHSCVLANQVITRAISLNIYRLCSDLKYAALASTGDQSAGIYWAWTLNIFKFFDIGTMSVSCLYVSNVSLLNSRHEGNLKINRLCECGWK